MLAQGIWINNLSNAAHDDQVDAGFLLDDYLSERSVDPDVISEVMNLS